MSAPPLPTTPTPATYEDLLAVPDHFRGELIAGELIVAPRPGLAHANAGIDLGADLRVRFGRSGPPGGWWILIEPELHLGQPDPRSLVLVPDLAGWRRERVPVLPAVSAFTLAPDWIAEILSPGRESYDRIRKADLYARLGVPWLWLVDPVEETLEVYELREGIYARIQAAEGRRAVQARPFEAVELDMTTWWLPSGEPPATER
ncbi:MAG: Uma2 family endonuclease [Pseudomonadota bacterium]